MPVLTMSARIENAVKFLSKYGLPDAATLEMTDQGKKENPLHYPLAIADAYKKAVLKEEAMANEVMNLFKDKETGGEAHSEMCKYIARARWSRNMSNLPDEYRKSAAHVRQVSETADKAQSNADNVYLYHFYLGFRFEVIKFSVKKYLAENNKQKKGEMFDDLIAETFGVVDDTRRSVWTERVRRTVFGGAYLAALEAKHKKTFKKDQHIADLFVSRKTGEELTRVHPLAIDPDKYADREGLVPLDGKKYGPGAYASVTRINEQGKEMFGKVTPRAAQPGTPATPPAPAADTTAQTAGTAPTGNAGPGTDQGRGADANAVNMTDVDKLGRINVLRMSNSVWRRFATMADEGDRIAYDKSLIALAEETLAEINAYVKAVREGEERRKTVGGINPNVPPKRVIEAPKQEEKKAEPTAKVGTAHTPTPIKRATAGSKPTRKRA